MTIIALVLLALVIILGATTILALRYIISSPVVAVPMATSLTGAGQVTPVPTATSPASGEATSTPAASPSATAQPVATVASRTITENLLLTCGTNCNDPIRVTITTIQVDDANGRMIWNISMKNVTGNSIGYYVNTFELLEYVGTQKAADRKKKRRQSSHEKGSVEMTVQLIRKPYPSDLTDAQWELLAPLIPEPAADSPREPIPRREIVNGILYVLRTGCPWRQMPHDLPNGKTVYYYFRLWKLDGTWEKAMSSLRKQVRTQMGRDPEPSAAIIESQSIKTAPVRGIERGYDGGKKNLGPQTASAR